MLYHQGSLTRNQANVPLATALSGVFRVSNGANAWSVGMYSNSHPAVLILV